MFCSWPHLQKASKKNLGPCMSTIPGHSRQLLEIAEEMFMLGQRQRPREEDVSVSEYRVAGRGMAESLRLYFATPVNTVVYLMWGSVIHTGG